MQRTVKESISRAKNYYKNHGDPVHDFSHIQRVVNNAKLIARHVEYQNPELIELAAYWHDVARTKGLEDHEEPGARMARQDLISRGFGDKPANLVYEAIRSHRLSDRPVSLEGQIIRDADKLDFISVERWKKGLQAKQYDYLLAMLTKLEEFPATLQLPHSKQLYAERLPKFMKYYESIKHQLPS